MIQMTLNGISYSLKMRRSSSLRVVQYTTIHGGNLAQKSVIYAQNMAQKSVALYFSNM
jgi:hypothetical protein